MNLYDMIILLMVKVIPQNLLHFFWDIDTNKIDLDKKACFIIQRLLDKGDALAVNWVLNNYSTQDITNTFETVRDFSPKIGNFWMLYLNIPKEKMLCLQEPYLKMRKNHWPY